MAHVCVAISHVEHGIFQFVRFVPWGSTHQHDPLLAEHSRLESDCFDCSCGWLCHRRSRDQQENGEAGEQTDRISEMSSHGSTPKVGGFLPELWQRSLGKRLIVPEKKARKIRCSAFYDFMNFATPLMNICTASITSNMPIKRSTAISPRSFNSR